MPPAWDSSVLRPRGQDRGQESQAPAENGTKRISTNQPTGKVLFHFTCSGLASTALGFKKVFAHVILGRISGFCWLGGTCLYCCYVHLQGQRFTFL